MVGLPGRSGRARAEGWRWCDRRGYILKNDLSWRIAQGLL